MRIIWWYRIQTMLMLTTGTMLLMWLGEQITERGIGNGVSLVITIGILARLPQAAMALKDMFFPGGGVEAKFNFGHAIALVLLLAGVIAGVIAITQAQRKIPVQYAQRAVGRKVYAGGTSFMPLRVNYCGRHADHLCPGHPDVPAEDFPVPGPELQREVLLARSRVPLSEGRLALHGRLRR